MAVVRPNAILSVIITMDPVVIYEDEHIIGINKPAGMAVHAGTGTGHTLVDWLIEHYPTIREVGEPYVSAGITVFRPGIVHRLDMETTGVLVIAKHQDMFRTLKSHFQKGKVEKEYHAFVYGRPKQVRGTVRLAIGKSRSDFRKQSVRHIRGEAREACTEYVLVRACHDKSSSFVSFYPKTGRTHQIRVHAQSLQIPIVCDSRYAPKRPPLLGFDRLALHARRITIHTHHHTDPLDIIAPYPEDFERALSDC